METITVWFLVTLFTSVNGDHWTLHQDHMPQELATQQECADTAVFKMVDRRSPTIKLWCIEADDMDDLVKILDRNFDFGQDRGQGS